MLDTSTDLLIRLKNNLPLFSELFLKIVNTEGQLVPLVFGETQLALHAAIEKQLKEEGLVRMVVPKGRKQGVSTYIEARFFHKLIFNPYKNAFILSHHAGTTKILFEMVQAFYNNLPAPMKLKKLTDNSQEIKFENNSKYWAATAGEGEIGRGGTPHYLHCSEAASFQNPEAINSGVMQSVAMAEGTEIVIESTSKGVGGLFHKYVMDAVDKKTIYKLCFLPWHMHKSNSWPAPEGFHPESDELDLIRRFGLTNDQLHWRRLQKASALSEAEFRREFPATLEEAFQSSEGALIDPQLVAEAVNRECDESWKTLVIGVDPARKGDRTAIVWRRGRKIERIETYTDMDEMRLSGILAKVINTDNPGKVFIDTGLGYGTIDRLNELGYSRIVQAVNFGESALDKEVYRNKRTEMAHEFKKWFEAGGVSVPDNYDFLLDIQAIPELTTESSGKVFLEPKDKIRKRLGKSPDLFDAAILTFAYPVKERNLDALPAFKLQRPQAAEKRGRLPGHNIKSAVFKNFRPIR